MEKAAVGGELPEKYRGACMKFVSFPYWNKRMGELIQMRRDELEDARRMLETETNPEKLREYEMRTMLLPVKIECMEEKMRVASKRARTIAFISIGNEYIETLEIRDISTPLSIVQHGMMQKALASYGG